MARKKAVKKEETVEVVVNNSPDTPTSIDSNAPVEPLQEDADVVDTVGTPEAENVSDGNVEGFTESELSIQEAIEQYKNGDFITIPKAIKTEDEFFEFLEEEDNAVLDPVIEEGLTKLETILENVKDLNAELDEHLEQTPEYYILDHANVPQPAVRIEIREPKLDALVRKVLEIAYLGGELYPQGIQLGRVPYRASMLIREDKYEAYTNGEGVAKINENALEVVVKGKDSGNFLKRLIEVGKGGAAIQDQRQVSKTGVYAAPLLTNTPVTASASISTGVKKPIYTVEDLKGFSAQQLRIVCNWYSLNWKGKVQARIDIIEKQKEIKV